MPLVSEEAAAPRKRSPWPTWLAWVMGTLALLLVGVGVLSLTECHLTVGPVYLDCGRMARESDCPQGYYRADAGGSSLHVIRIGTWHWGVAIDQ